jgi:subtilisin family serine protease
MIKREFIKSKYYIILGTILFLLALPVLLQSSVSTQEQKEFKETGGEIVVVFKEEIGENDLWSLKEKLGQEVQIKRHIGDYALFSVDTASDFHNVLKRLEAEPQVLAAQSNSEVSILSTSSDPYADTQWYIDNTGRYINLTSAVKRSRYSVKGIDMDVTNAWEIMAEDESLEREVIVAVIDTGIDYNHPDLAENIWVNKGEIDGDNIDNDNNGYVDDVYGWDFYNDDASVCHYEYSKEYKMNIALPSDNDNHGTHIAGIIGAVANNNIGIAGIAANINIKLMPLKINGGKEGTGDISDAIEAIKYATQMGAEICNISWGTSVDIPGLKEIMKESDMLFVAAAGNSGSDIDDDPIYPANYKLDNLITVATIDSMGELASYSNYGAKTVDLAAPGDDIYSTIVGRYTSMSGSSMAAPQVTAIAAMLYAYGDHLYASNVKNIITSNMKPLESLEGYMINAGIPSAYQAIMAAGDLTEDTASPVMSFATEYHKTLIQIPIHIEDEGNSQVRVIRWLFGDKTVKDFKRGMDGTPVEEKKVSLKKAGTYTFYASDYAGNETVQTYKVEADSKAPKLSSSYAVSDDYKYRTIAVKASDGESGLKSVKYLSGVKNSKDFIKSGTEVIIKYGKGTFRVKKDGTYTIYAVDHMGNTAVKQIVVKTQKAVEFKLLTDKKTMVEGDQFILKADIKPLSSTDKITYTSMNPNVATVTSSGKVTAVSKGYTYIMARTSSGITSICTITVRLRE